MIHFLLGNYLVPFIAGSISVFTLIITVILPSLGKKSSTWKSFIVFISISILIGILVGIISGNLYNMGNRQNAITLLVDLHNDLISKEKETKEYWAKTGVGVTSRQEMPWPLLLSPEELKSWSIKYSQLYSITKKYFSNDVLNLVHEIQLIIDIPHVSTMSVQCEGPVGSTVTADEATHSFEARCDDGKKGVVISKHSLSHKQKRLLVALIDVINNKMNSEASVTYVPLIIHNSLELHGKYFFADTEAWIRLGETAESCLAGGNTTYRAMLINGLALFVTGREDRGAKALSETISRIDSGNLLYRKNDELTLMGCALLYKYYTYPSPENSISAKPMLASMYKNIGNELGGEKFISMLSEMEMVDYGDPDLTWHYRMTKTSPKRIEAGDIGTAIIW